MIEQEYEMIVLITIEEKVSVKLGDRPIGIGGFKNFIPFFHPGSWFYIL